MEFEDEVTSELSKLIADNSTPIRSRSQRKARQPVSISGTGHTTVLGDRCTVVVRAGPTIVADVRPGEHHITDEQATRVRFLVSDVVRATGETYQSVWHSVYARARAPRYRLIPLAAFDDLEAYLQRCVQARRVER